MGKPADEVRRQVSETYAQAVSAQRGCCGAGALQKDVAAQGCCGGGAGQKGTAAQLAGYSPEELATLPEQAVVNSFGCGDPVALAGLKPGEVVLDLGSGAGMDLLLAARKVGPRGRAIGVDMTEQMLAKAKENIRASGLANVEVRRGIIEELPVESGSVDWVISNCVINLSPEKGKVFREISRVLKPGGRMLVSDIVAKDLTEEEREAVERYASCVAGAIDEESYLAGLREVGLVEGEIRDRLHYDAGQVEALASSDLEELYREQGREKIHALARSLAGKVWSARIFARKPERA